MPSVLAAVLELAVFPLYGIVVAAFTPDPEVLIVQPVPQVNVPELFVPPPKPGKFAAPPIPRPVK